MSLSLKKNAHTPAPSPEILNVTHQTGTAPKKKQVNPTHVRTRTKICHQFRNRINRQRQLQKTVPTYIKNNPKTTQTPFHKIQNIEGEEG